MILQDLLMNHEQTYEMLLATFGSQPGTHTFKTPDGNELQIAMTFRHPNSSYLNMSISQSGSEPIWSYWYSHNFQNDRTEPHHKGELSDELMLLLRDLYLKSANVSDDHVEHVAALKGVSHDDAKAMIMDHRLRPRLVEVPLSAS
jgi:hypothetical protein